MFHETLGPEINLKKWGLGPKFHKAEKKIHQLFYTKGVTKSN